MQEEYDVVVVGGGTSGSVVASRLANAGARVCLIEAGPSDLATPVVADIRNWLSVLGGPLDYAVPIDEPASAASYSAGRVLGGSSSLNNVWAFETPSTDLDRWVAEGLSRRTSEGLESTRPRVRAVMGASPVTDPHPASVAFLAGASQRGLPLRTLGGESLATGAGLVRLTARGTTRRSASTAYLHDVPVPGLDVVVDARVNRMLIGPGGAVEGVETDRGAVRADRVVLSAGALHSPTMLMRSGIGPAAHLSEHGIPVLVDQTNVGLHLQDHPLTGATWRARRAEPTVHSHGWETAAFTSGAITGEDLDACVLFSTMPSPFGLPADAHELAEGGYTLAAYLARPASRGTVRLRSADPASAPVVRAPFLNDPEGRDRAALVKAISVLRDLARSPALQPWLDEEVEPGPAAADERLEEYVSGTLGTMFHPTSTCRMGSEPEGSVVDEDYNVWGVSGLRVCDASVLPSVPTVPPYLTCLMFAERCSDVMIDDARK